MKRSVLLVLMVIGSLGVSAQNENAWIDFQQSYFKFKVGEDGIYRISRQALQESGMPAGTVDPRRIQLFNKGKELAIFISGQSDGVFDETDFIEFYGQRNDGQLDTELYVAPEAQPHTRHSLFSDSSVYFLTWSLTNQQGKRRLRYVDNNVNNQVAESYHLAEVARVEASQYHEGRSYGLDNDIVLSEYDFGEGFTGNAFSRGQSRTLTISGLVNGVQNQAVPKLEILLSGRNNNAHNADIFVGPSSNSLRKIGNVSWERDDVIEQQFNLTWTDISPLGDLVLRVSALGVNGVADRMSVSSAIVTLAQSYNMSEAASKVFRPEPNPLGSSYLEILNYAPGTQLYDITDPTNFISVGSSEINNRLTAMVRNTNINRTIFASSDFKQVTNLQPVSFTPVPAVTDYLIITHPLLRSGGTQNSDPVAAYAAYRASQQGGGFDVMTLNIEEVFDQFAFGIPSPIGLRNLANYLLSVGSPSYIFLIGKGLSVNFDYYRKDPATTAIVNLVPTFGYPGADELFTTNLGAGLYNATIPIGRLNARSGAEVEHYLNKVIEMEATPYNQLWRKDVIHLSGGANLSEQVRFRQYMESFENVVEGKFMGADVVTETKQTTNAVEFFNITEEVNQGKSLITFFGHSGSFSTDIDIGFVTNPAYGYDNAGKYPVILVNGCNAGDLYSDAQGFGEDWIAAENKGAIAFMAHSKQAYSSNLRTYTEEFYDAAFADPDFFGRSLGVIKREVGRRYFDRNGTIETSVTQVNQFVLLGDPAVKLFAPEHPDFAIEEFGIALTSFDGKQLTSKADSFLLKFPVTNLGRYEEGNLQISVSRILSDGAVVEYPPKAFEAVLRSDTLFFTITNDQTQGNDGPNTFSISLDPNNIIDELDETNNSVTVDFVINSGSTTNLFPADLSIVDDRTVELIVQSSDVVSEERGYSVEIDTLSTFSSPYAQTINVQAKSVAVFAHSLQGLPDSTTIYWKSSFANPQPGESTEPALSSFTLIEAIDDGWAIMHEDQYENLSISGIERDVQAGQWTFQTIINSLSVVTHGSDAEGMQVQDVELLLNGLNYMVNSSPLDPFCRDNTMNVVAFERQSALPYKVLPTSGADVQNNLICGRIPQLIYNLRDVDIYNPASATGGNRYLKQIIDVVKENEYVLIFTIGSINYQQLDDVALAALSEIGISPTVVSSLSPGQPLIALGRKGSGEAIVVRDNGSPLPPEEQVIIIDETIIGRNNTGIISSPIIGPATRWDNYYANIGVPDGATYLTEIIGISPSGEESVLLNTGSPGQNLGFIQATEYPFLKLSLDIPASASLEPPQFKHWAIDYVSPPEGVLLYKGSESQVLVQVGESKSVPFAFWNISTSNYTDSLSVSIEQINNTNRTMTSSQFLVAAPSAGDSIAIEVPIATEQGAGLYNLKVVVEPRSDREQIIANNQLTLTDFINIGGDNVNPILDVAFDGIYIMDGDIVSPNPRINILVRDFGSLVQKTDTAGVNIFLKQPCETCTFERVNLSSPEITFEAATDNEDFKVEYQPQSLEDGVYGLRVQATDGSGNASGVSPYEINFEVVNESTITHFYPYPNPFSTSTRFVFTLTGSVIPDQLKIQIMTVNGRVVREITQNEIGPIRVGNNVTEFAWNGTDEYGDRLANGVYLYRVITRQNGQNIDHRETFADNAFKNGFGKLYILR